MQRFNTPHGVKRGYDFISESPSSKRPRQQNPTHPRQQFQAFPIQQNQTFPRRQIPNFTASSQFKSPTHFIPRLMTPTSSRYNPQANASSHMMTPNSNRFNSPTNASPRLATPNSTRYNSPTNASPRLATPNSTRYNSPTNASPRLVTPNSTQYNSPTNASLRLATPNSTRYNSPTIASPRLATPNSTRYNSPTNASPRLATPNSTRYNSPTNASPRLVTPNSTQYNSPTNASLRLATPNSTRYNSPTIASPRLATPNSTRHNSQTIASPSLVTPSSSRCNSLRTASSQTLNNIQKEMQTYFGKNQQSQVLFSRKIALRDALFQIIRSFYPECCLYVVGSSLNGFGSNNSDLDLCLLLANCEMESKVEAVKVLAKLRKKFDRCRFLKGVLLIRAKVPILKFKDIHSNVECDLNINNVTGIQNTFLMRSYSQVDPRVRPLILFAKYWAKQQNINDASQGTISSYSLALMVIHYLQCGASPPVLPSLQAMHPEYFDIERNVTTFSLDDYLPAYVSENKQTEAELFYGFLDYYANTFNFDTDAISVRLGEKVTRNFVMKTAPDTQWKFVCIEEPFNLLNTARSIFDNHTFQRIHRVIRRSFELLHSSEDVCSILYNPV